MSGWLFVSAYNRSINVLKKQLQESLAIKNIDNQELSMNEYHEISEMQILILEDAVNQLSPQKKRVFELCKFQGMSYEETAKEMKISKHTVKEYLSEAMSFVKEYARQYPQSSIAIAILLDALNS